MARLAPGVNVIGQLSSGIGLGAAARSTLRVLGQRGIAHAAVDLDSEPETIEEPLSPSVRRLPTLRSLPFSASVVHLNPDMFGELLRWQSELSYDMRPTVNALVPFWELPAFPSTWLPALQSVDVVLAPTKYIRDAAERTLPSHLRPLVWEYPQAVYPPPKAVANRARWLQERADRVTFLVSFDIMSGIDRKNPWASVAAFQRAFAQRDDVALLMKVNRATDTRARERFAELQQLVDGDSRIQVMTESLDREDLWSLYASVDSYVSLHRSEGLGLGLMEAMAVGKPVIATAWSGNMDFMDAQNSVLVPYRLVPVVSDHPNYQRDLHQKWADPDVDSASSAMRALADSPALRARLGGEAALSMRRRTEDQAKRGVLDDLVELASRGEAATRRHKAHARAGRQVAATPGITLGTAWEATKRFGVGALRKLRIKPPAPPDENQPEHLRILS